MGDVDRFGPALVRAMVNVSDLVAVIDADGRIEYMNPFGLELFGCADEQEIIGTAVVDLIHPDDVGRVLTAITRMLAVDVEIPGRPAIMRLRRADGSYVRVEANGAGGASPSDDTSVDRMVVIARPTTDADLHERLMGLLTRGEPSELAFELVPQFGLWRQPNLDSAVFVLGDDGRPLAFGNERVLALGAIDDPFAPWVDAIDTGGELLVSVDELAEVPRARAAAQGITFLRARLVPDALNGAHAAVVMAHDTTSPLPGVRSTLDFAWFAIDKMASVLEMALAWRHQAVELQRRADTDPLTGLANRAGFSSSYLRTTAALADETVSVLCIDLDRFKPVNDSHGHGVGDGLLIEVADRLRRIVRPDDLVARLGGDEFAVVVHDLDDDQVAVIADRIVTELAAPFVIAGHTISIGASVGVAGVSVDGFDAGALLDAADKALYEAKAAGRNQWIR